MDPYNKHCVPVKHIIKFGAPYCAPCKVIDAILDDICTTLPVERHDLSTAEGSAKAYEYEVNALPTVLLMEGTEVLERLVGASLSTVTKLREFIRQV